MIALITSTLIPNDSSYSFFSNKDRYEQTIQTINRLREVGFKFIYLFDNSPSEINIDQLKKDTIPDLIVTHSSQYNFENKGLNEALLLLNHIHLLPDDVSIFKISARYHPNDDFGYQHLNFKDYVIAGKGYCFSKKHGTFSTRAYFVKNKAFLTALLNNSIEDMLSYANGIHGIKSFLRTIKKILIPDLTLDYQLSIEHSFARIIKKKHPYLLLKKVGIEGYVAGTNHLEKISE